MKFIIDMGYNNSLNTRNTSVFGFIFNILQINTCNIYYSKKENFDGPS